jgi:hypothetical protein
MNKKSCNQHPGIVLEYDAKLYSDCPLCACRREIDNFYKAMRAEVFKFRQILSIADVKKIKR